MTVHMNTLLKLTLVGDGSVGKSCLILQYMYGDFTEEYEPTKADAYRRTITIQGDEVQIDILDTAGQEDYLVVRDGYLKNGDGFLIVFDLTNRKTFESIKTHRENVQRVKADDHVPIILVGNKNDLTSDRVISFAEASSLANQWNVPYIETSAKTKDNVDKAFYEILIKIKDVKDLRSNSFLINSTVTEPYKSSLPRINTKHSKHDIEAETVKDSKNNKSFCSTCKESCTIF